jgi:hypothetical protein
MAGYSLVMRRILASSVFNRRHLAIQGGFIGAETIDEALRSRRDVTSLREYEQAVRYAGGFVQASCRGFTRDSFENFCSAIRN